MPDVHADCRVCQVVRDPLPHAPEPAIDLAASRAFALADRRLDRDENTPDLRDVL